MIVSRPMSARPVRRKAPPPPPIPLPAGQRVGRYELRHVIGSGHAGIVYRAFDDESEDEIAVKEYMPPGLATRHGAAMVVPRTPEDAEVYGAGLQSFVAEAQALATVEHPRLIKVHAVWEENGTAYVAMALVVGRNLALTQQTRGRAPREATLRSILNAMLEPLAALHAAGFHHGDIAPETWMIDAQGHPVLMDRGSPRLLAEARKGPGPTGRREGYSPIELYPAAEGAPAPAQGPWTDIYALGAVLYFVISGKPPPPAPQRGTEMPLARALRNQDGRYTMPFLGIVDWMLAPRPADRPQSLQEVRDALAGKNVPARYVPVRGGRLRPLLRRLRWLWWTLLAVALLGGAALGTRQALKTEIVQRVILKAKGLLPR